MTAMWRILEGDCREQLATLEPSSVQTCVTSPPYFGLRDYGTGLWDGGDPCCDHRRPSTKVGGATTLRNDGRAHKGLYEGEKAIEPGFPFSEVCGKCGARRVDRQIGLEPTPDEYVAGLVAVFREVRRVLRDDGTVWLNLGSSYFSDPKKGGSGPNGKNESRWSYGRASRRDAQPHSSGMDAGGMAWLNYTSRLKPKDLIPIPWMVAMALQADGWYLRCDVIWNKCNPMPESVTDRPTKAHEYLFLLSKGPRYFYDADAIREEAEDRPLSSWAERREHEPLRRGDPGDSGHVTRTHTLASEPGRNKRSVWTVATQPFPGAHFATFPPKLIEPCILAGSSPKACGECGAPWRRVVERSGPPPEPEHRNPAKRLEPGQAGNVGAGNMGFRASRLSGQEMAAWKAQNPDRTVGWEPSCDHQDDTGQSVVLDPFAGSGTTGVVALRHDRSFIGCELNPEYVRLARDRIIGDSPLLNTHAEAA